MNGLVSTREYNRLWQKLISAKAGMSIRLLDQGKDITEEHLKNLHRLNQTEWDSIKTETVLRKNQN